MRTNQFSTRETAERRVHPDELPGGRQVRERRMYRANADGGDHGLLRRMLRGLGRAAAAIDRFVASSAATLPERAEINDQALLADIRRLFIDGSADYSVHDLARLWRVSVADVLDIFSDEVAARYDGDKHAIDHFRVSEAEAIRASIAFQIFRPIQIECALGSKLEHVLSAAHHTVAISVFLPQFVVAAVLKTPAIPHGTSLPARIERILSEWCAAEDFEVTKSR